MADGDQRIRVTHLCGQRVDLVRVMRWTFRGFEFSRFSGGCWPTAETREEAVRVATDRRGYRNFDAIKAASAPSRVRYPVDDNIHSPWRTYLCKRCRTLLPVDRDDLLRAAEHALERCPRRPEVVIGVDVPLRRLDDPAPADPSSGITVRALP